MAKRYSQPQGGPLRIDWANPLTRGLVGLYLLNEAGGVVCYDATGKNAAATLVNAPSRVITPKGRAVRTASSGSKYLSVANKVGGPLDITGAITCMGAVNVAAFTTARNPIISKLEVSLGQGYYLDVTGDPFIRFLQSASAGVTYNAALSLNTDHVVAGTYGDSLASIYVDGQVKATAAATAPAANTVPLDFGARSGFDSTNFLDGVLYWAAVWNRALLPSEVLFFSSVESVYSMVASPRRIWGAAGGSATFSYAPTGGVILSGIASIVRSGSRATSGGVLLSGTSSKLAGKAEPAPVGGLTFSGSASQLLGRTITPTGGLSFAGAASSARSVIRVVAGGLLFAGTSAMSTVNSLVVVPVGGLLVSGTAATVRTCTRLVAGGLTLAGHAVAEFGNIYAAVADWVGFIRRGGRR